MFKKLILGIILIFLIVGCNSSNLPKNADTSRNILDTTQASELPAPTSKTMEYTNNTYEYTIDILATPQVALEIKPKIANEDPIQTAIDFINWKNSKGILDINGSVQKEDLEILKKTDEEVILKVNDGKVQINKIYLRPLIGENSVRMWFIIGYDPIWIGSIRTVYVEGKVSFFDKDKNIVEIEVKKNIHKGTSSIDSQDSPFAIGAKEKFRLIELTKVSFDDIKNIIIAVNKYSIEDTNFYGCEISYYEKDGKWFDIYGTEANYKKITSR